MSIAPHPDFRVQKLRIGREQAPLVVIDNLVADADKLVEMAAGKTFVDVTNNYPGVRTKTPLAYQQLVRDLLRGEVAAYFGLDGSRLHFTACHFSLVTTPPEKLTPLQRLPHVDSNKGNELAFVRSLAAWHLGRLGPAFPGIEQALLPLRQLAGDKDPSVRVEAALALGMLDEGKGAPPPELKSLSS